VIKVQETEKSGVYRFTQCLHNVCWKWAQIAFQSIIFSKHFLGETPQDPPWKSADVPPYPSWIVCMPCCSRLLYGQNLLFRNLLTTLTTFISSHACLKKPCLRFLECALCFIFTSKYIWGWEVIATASEKYDITLKWKEELKFADTD